MVMCQSNIEHVLDDCIASLHQIKLQPIHCAPHPFQARIFCCNCFLIFTNLISWWNFNCSIRFFWQDPNNKEPSKLKVHRDTWSGHSENHWKCCAWTSQSCSSQVQCQAICSWHQTWSTPPHCFLNNRSIFNNKRSQCAKKPFKFGSQPFKGFNIQSSQSYHSLTVSGFIQLSPCTRLWILEWNSWDPAVPQPFHYTRKVFVESLPVSWMNENRIISPLLPVEKKS